MCQNVCTFKNIFLYIVPYNIFTKIYTNILFPDGHTYNTNDKSKLYLVYLKIILNYN